MTQSIQIKEAGAKTGRIKIRQAKPQPMLPLVIPSAPGEGGEEAEFLDEPPGSAHRLVREFSLEEARDMLRAHQVKSLPTDRQLRKMLTKVRLIARRSGDQLVLCIFLGDRTLAPWVRHFVRMEGERGLGRCPKCGDWFVQDRPDQIYCSVAHREYHRLKRWRAAGAGAGKTELFVAASVVRTTETDHKK